MKWGRQRNYKQTKIRQDLIQFRIELVSACQLPYNLLFNNLRDNGKYKEYYEKVRDVKDSLYGVVCKLPRKLKKKVKRSYDL